jgi:hypothetical protein
MSSSGILRRVDYVRTDVSEESIASIIWITRIGELGTMLAVTSNSSVLRLLVTVNVPSSPILITVKTETIRSSETSVLARAKWRNIPEDDILQREFLSAVYSTLLVESQYIVECYHN